MAVPSVITDLNVVAASNSPAGTDPIGNTLDDFLRGVQAIVRREQAQGAAIASAATTNIASNTDGNYVHITGTTTITSFGTVAAGISRTVVFDGVLTLTHDSTSLILPGGASITTAAGDIAEFISEGSGNWRCTKYQFKGALPIAQGGTGGTTASAARLALSAAASGSNSDITALSGLTTALSIAQGGTGATTASAAGSALGAIGVGQSWNDVLASRALGTTYTNSTGRPIMVVAQCLGTGSGQSSYIVNVGGVILANPTTTESNGTTWNGINIPISFIVPNGATYSISNNTLTNTLARWLELR